MNGQLTVFAALVSGYTVKLMTRLHHTMENVLLVLIALHVAAVLLYLLVRKDDLITPMITGRKRLADSPALRFAAPWLALLLLALSVAAVAALIWKSGG